MQYKVSQNTIYNKDGDGERLARAHDVAEGNRVAQVSGHLKLEAECAHNIQ